MKGVNSGHYGLLDLHPARAKAWGSAYYRFPLDASKDPLPTILACLDAGIAPIPVLVREAADQPIEYWANLIGPYITVIQVCNEPDGTSEGEGASWVMTQDELNTWIGEARRWFPRPRYKLLGPGLISGNPDWLRGVNISLLDALCPHPYAKEPHTAALNQMLEGYLRFARLYSIRLWITEYDSRVSGMGEYLLGYEGVDSALVFCGHSYGSFGLVDHPAALEEFIALEGGGEVPPEQPWIGDGLKASLKQYNATPTTGEYPAPIVQSDKGIHIWLGEQDRALFLPWNALPARKATTATKAEPEKLATHTGAIDWDKVIA